LAEKALYAKTKLKLILRQSIAASAKRQRRTNHVAQGSEIGQFIFP
jgi:hypothetical protein